MKVPSVSMVLSNEDFGEPNTFYAMLPAVSKKRAVKELIALSKKSLREIARDSGGKIRYNTISGWQSAAEPEPNFEFDSIVAFARGLGFPAVFVFETLYSKTITKKPGALPDYLREMLEGFNDLTETERESLAGTVELLAMGISNARTRRRKR